MPITTFRRASAVVFQDGNPTDILNITGSGTVIFDDQNDTATIGPFHKAQDSPIVNSFFSDEIPSNATVTGIEVQVGAVHLNSGAFTPSNAFKTQFQVLRAISTVDALSNNFTESGTAFTYDGSDHLTYYDTSFGGGLADPNSYNFNFGGDNNLVGLTSNLNYDEYDHIGLKITFIDESNVSGADLRVASRLFAHSIGPSPAIRLHYIVPSTSKIHILNNSKFSITNNSKLSIT